MMCRNVKMLAAAAVAVVMLAAGAWAQESWNCGSPNAEDVTATLSEDGTLTISGTGNMASYARRNAPWYGSRESITEIVIGDGVTSIGQYAFDTLYNLTSITIPGSVTSIATYFVHRAINLTNLEVGDNNSRYSSVDGVLFTKAQDTLVRYPEGKQDITYSIPESVTHINTDAFFNSTGTGRLTQVTIPEGVISIGTYAFQGCSGLTSVTIPNSVTSIANYAFQQCIGLTSVTIGNGVKTIGRQVFQNLSNLTSVTIGNSVESIGIRAFDGCTSLTSVTIPSSVTSIGDTAFSRCTGLTSVTSLIEVPPTIVAGVFSYMTLESVVLNVPEGSVEAYKAADVWSGFGDVLSLITVTFDAQDGSAVAPQTIPHNGKVSEPEEPTRADHTFGGWYKEAACTNEWDFAADVVTETTTLFAKWTANTYEVTFSAGENGSLAATVDGSAITTGALVQYGKSVVFTATPDEGYDVIGWTLNGAEVAGADDNTYTLSVSAAAVVAVSFGKTNAIAQSDRAIPTVKPKEEATVIAPVTVLSGEFTAGPNPVAKQSGIVNFYRQGKRVSNSELRIYDATGNIINKVKISDKALNSQARRQVGTWDLTDKSGRQVSEGTYLVKGVIKTSDGKSEKVSVILGVR